MIEAVPVSGHRGSSSETAIWVPTSRRDLLSPVDAPGSRASSRGPQDGFRRLDTALILVAPRHSRYATVERLVPRQGAAIPRPTVVAALTIG